MDTVNVTIPCSTFPTVVSIVSLELIETLRKSISDRRYDTAMEVIKALTKLLETTPITSFKVGDHVEVVRKITQLEGAKWNDIWVDQMDSCIGCSGIIRSIQDNGNIQVLFDTDNGKHSHYFPPYVLQKVNHE